MPPTLEPVRDLLLSNALSTGSSKAYRSHLQQFCQFLLESKNVCSNIPVNVQAIVSYVCYLYDKGFAHSTISSHLSAISYAHRIKGFIDPTKAFIIKKLIQGASRLRPSADLRAPITKDILQKLVLSTSHTTLSIYHRQLFTAMYLLAFHAFLRIGEIATQKCNASNVIQYKDVNIVGQNLSITFYTFKHHKGPPVYISVPAQKSLFCPVWAMTNYLSQRGRQPGPLFILPGGFPVSKSFFQENLQRSLSWAGLSSTSYKGHSFRIGAASTAALQGLSDEEIQRMGRWKSQAFKKYIRIPIML